MSKYQPIADYLSTQSGASVRLSFGKIEKLIGGGLPQSAKTYPAWWANSRANDSHTWPRVWLNVGWRTMAPNLSEQIVLFQRVKKSPDGSSKNSRLAITWRDDESGGYTDVFDADTFTTERAEIDITHCVHGPRGGLSNAKCRLTTRDKTAELDYVRFEKFNQRQGMLIGITRIRFADDDRTLVQSMEWKPKGSTGFRRCPFEFQEYQLPPIADYKGPGKQARLVSRKVLDRPGQAKFRKKLKQAYNNTCCISGCSVSEALEGAHIDPYEGSDSNNLQNGLLLRRDLHRLFDVDRIGIEPKTLIVHVAKEARIWPGYDKLHGKQLSPPTNGGESYYPSAAALGRKWKLFGSANNGNASGSK